MITTDEPTRQIALPSEHSNSGASNYASKACLWLNGIIYGAIALSVVAHVLAKTFITRPFWRALFDLRCEQNIPTWLAVVLWLLVAQFAVAAFVLDRHKHPGDKMNSIWLLIVAAFTYASVDDLAMVHEHFIYIHYQHSLVHWQMFYMPAMLLCLFGGGSLLWRRFAPFPKYRFALVYSVLLFILAMLLEALQQDNYTLCLMLNDPFLRKTELCWFAEELCELVATALIVSSVGGYVFRTGLTKSAAGRRA